MKPLIIEEIREIIDGELVQGTDNLVIEHCAYRLKQIRKKNCLFFSKTIVLNWDNLKDFFPLTIVTDTSKELTKRIKNMKDLTIIKVSDLKKAYWDFIIHYRSIFNIPVVAITGTCGKTTTKEMIRHILEVDKRVVSTQISNNSRTAHLQYLLSIDEETDVAVFETAVGAPGDILQASQYFAPTIGVITNIGVHHLNFCKTEEDYISAKGEMVHAVDDNGILIINADDKNTKKIKLKDFKGKLVTIGIHSEANYKASNIKYSNNGMEFILSYKDQNHSIFVSGFGEHQVFNALAAISTAHQIGISITDSIARISTFIPLKKHLQFFEGINGSKIIDDTWSSTTTSIEAALKVLSEVGKEKKKVAILSSMTDLGTSTYHVHEQAGEIIAKMDVDILITLGYFSKRMANWAIKCGFKGSHYSFGNSSQVVRFLEKQVNENTLILVKGDMYAKEPKEIVSNLLKKEPSN